MVGVVPGRAHVGMLDAAELSGAAFESFVRRAGECGGVKSANVVQHGREGACAGCGGGRGVGGSVR